MGIPFSKTQNLIFILPHIRRQCKGANAVFFGKSGKGFSGEGR